MKLNPNCSEAICRVKVEGLDIIKKEQLLDTLKNRFDSEGDEDNYNTTVYEDTIFGIPIIVIEGDAPYNRSEEVEEVLRGFGINDYESQEK